MTRLLTDEEVLGEGAPLAAPRLLSDDEVLGFTLPAPPPSGTLEEVLKHASETFQHAVDEGVSLEEADRAVTAEAEAKPAAEERAEIAPVRPSDMPQPQPVRPEEIPEWVADIVAVFGATLPGAVGTWWLGVPAVNLLQDRPGFGEALQKRVAQRKQAAITRIPAGEWPPPGLPGPSYWPPGMERPPERWPIPPGVPFIGRGRDPVFELFSIWSNAVLLGGGIGGVKAAAAPALAPAAAVTARSVAADVGRQAAHTSALFGSLGFAAKMQETGGDVAQSLEAGAQSTVLGLGAGLVFGAVLNAKQIHALYLNRSVVVAHKALQDAGVSGNQAAYVKAKGRYLKAAAKVFRETNDTAGLAAADLQMTKLNALKERIARKKVLEASDKLFAEMKSWRISGQGGFEMTGVAARPLAGETAAIVRPLDLALGESPAADAFRRLAEVPQVAVPAQVSPTLISPRGEVTRPAVAPLPRVPVPAAAVVPEAARALAAAPAIPPAPPPAPAPAVPAEVPTREALLTQYGEEATVAALRKNTPGWLRMRPETQDKWLAGELSDEAVLNEFLGSALKRLPGAEDAVLEIIEHPDGTREAFIKNMPGIGAFNISDRHHMEALYAAVEEGIGDLEGARDEAAVDLSEAIAPEVPVTPPAPEVVPVPEKPPEVAPTPPAEAVVPAEEVVAEAPEAIPAEEVPFEVRVAEAPELLTPEQARIQSYLRDLSPPELVRALKRMPGPYGGTLAETLGVGKATKVLATAQKKLRAEEAAAKKALAETKAAYPDALVEAEAITAGEASLLGILGPRGRVTYRKGVEHGVETAKAIEGRSLAIRRHFTKAEGMTLEDLQMAWSEQRGIPAKDAPSLSEILSRLMGEIETFEAAKAEGRAPLEQQLRDLAANVPEEVSEELLAGVDRLAEAQGAVWSAHDALLKEATPYLVAEEMAAPISAEVEIMERDAAAKVARADQALRSAEAVRTLADRGLITVAEQTKVLKAAAKLSGVPHVASILRAVARATTPEGLEAARERLAWALERHVKREHAHRAARMARRIESWARRQKFDPRDRRAAVLLQMASDTSETGLMLQDLEVVKARERVLAEGLYEYQTADELIKSDVETRAADLAGTLRGEMDENALGRIDRAEVARADVGLIRGLPHYMYKALTTLEQVFGPDSQAEKLFFEFSLGKEDESTGARAYYRLLHREDAWLNSELSEATGMNRREKSERYMDWLIRPLALDLPDAGRVELTVDEWMGLVNTARDRDGDLQVALVPLTRAANRAEAPFAEALTNADRAAMLSGLDRADPKILKAADVYWTWHQNKERFREWSEAWHAIKGWWPEELPDYYPLHRDIPREAPSLLQVPGMEETVADRMAHAVREVGFMQERIPDAISPLLIKGAELEYLSHSRTGSALVAYGVPAKNIEKVLNAGEPSFLRQMEATVGRTVARSVWVDTVRHVLDTAGLSPGAGIQGNQRLEQLAHQGMSNIGVAYFVASPFTARSQLFGIFGKLSDPSSPTSLTDFLAGIGEALRHPLRYWHELAELSPLVEHRVAHAPALYMFGDVREAQARRPIWAFARWWRRLKAAAVKKLFWARHTDAWTQVARYRTNYRYQRRQGLSPEAARAKAARMTEMDIENQDFPAHAGSADMLSQQARRGILKRGLVFAGQSRASQANLLIRNFNRFRRDKDVKKFLKSIIGVLLTAIGISATNVLRRVARYKALREPGKAAGEFVAELLTSILGNVHVVRQLVSSIRYFYGGVQALPVLGPVDDLVGAVRSLYSLIDKWDEKKAWRAAWRMSYATAILSGIPVSGAHGMYRIVEGLMPEEVGGDAREMQKRAAGR